MIDYITLPPPCLSIVAIVYVAVCGYILRLFFTHQYGLTALHFMASFSYLGGNEANLKDTAMVSDGVF